VETFALAIDADQVDISALIADLHQFGMNLALMPP
jgi:hypothetical protein